MNKTAIPLLLSSILTGLVGCDQASDWIGARSSSELKRGTVKVGDQLFDVELAGDIWSKSQGLMFRESLAPGSGMLFLGYAETAIWPFWMKNTLIPLDIVWITEDFKVAVIQTATPCKQDPCPVYVPKLPSRYVLEVNGGEFKGRIGDPVEISTEPGPQSISSSR